MKRELEVDQQTHTISCTTCGGSGRIPALVNNDVVVTVIITEPFNFTALPPELQLFIATACGHDLFSLACASRDTLSLVTAPQNHTFERTTAFRYYYHLDYCAPKKNQRVSAQRLKLLSPTCIKLRWSEAGIDCATLLALQSSLTALEMHDCDWKMAGQPIECVLPQLTQLKHLVIYDCAFECEYVRDGRWRYSDGGYSPPFVCDQIAQLTGLQTLQLISEVPFDDDCLKNLTELRWLDVQTYETPTLASLTHLVNLEILVVEGREMAERDTDGWACLTSLRKLYVINSYDDNDQVVAYDQSFLPEDFTQRVRIMACATGYDPLANHVHAIKSGTGSIKEKEEEEDGDNRKDLGQYYWDSSHESSSDSSSEHSTDCDCTDCASSSISSDAQPHRSSDDSDDDDSVLGDMSGADTPTCQCSDCIDGSSGEDII